MTAKQKLHQTNLSLWMARSNDQASSGLTIREWCSQNDISVHAYNYWKHIAKETYIDSVLPSIVPVNTAPTSISQTESGHFSWPRNSSEVKQLSPTQFNWLMQGFSIEPIIHITHPDRLAYFLYIT